MGRHDTCMISVISFVLFRWQYRSCWVAHPLVGVAELGLHHLHMAIQMQ